MILQGPAKSKMKVMVDKEQEGGVDSNNSHATNGNGCMKGTGDSVDESECSPCVPEENNILNDRPLKKAKSENVEICCSVEGDNGWFYLY